MRGMKYHIICYRPDETDEFTNEESLPPSKRKCGTLEFAPGSHSRSFLTVLKSKGSGKVCLETGFDFSRFIVGLRIGRPRNAGRMSHASIPWQWRGH
jgi:hypothetical protein